MIVGQALALALLDTATLERGGLTTREELLSNLAGVMGTDSLMRALNPKRRRYDERAAQETVRAKVGEALRRLASLGFIDLRDDGGIRLRVALLRFAEPVRGLEAPDKALARLVEKGEAAFAEPDRADDDAARSPSDGEQPDDDARDSSGPEDGEGAIDDDPFLSEVAPDGEDGA